MTEKSESSRLANSRLILFAILAVTAVLALVSAVLFQEPGLLNRDKVLTDFDAFYVAGQMADRGQSSETYQIAEMLAAQRDFSGTVSFMPWTYLPPYLLVVQGLAQLPIGFSFIAFFAATFAFYLATLRRIAGALLPGVLIATLPTILLLARTGQNGFLTAGLIGWFLLAFTERRAIAGAPLGLMVIKPHLAAGIALVAMLERRWGAVMIAGAIVIGSLLAASAVYGLDVWPAFVGGLRNAGEFLAAGYYPMFRMSSVYATVLTLGGGPEVAFRVQAAGALVAVGVLVKAVLSRWEPRRLAATVCVSSVFVSPYNYDYDLTIIGIAIAFVLPQILERTRRHELAGLVLLCWAVTGYGLVANSIYGGFSAETVTSLQDDGALSLTAPLLLLLVASGVAILRREPVSPATIAGLARPTDADRT